MGFCDFKDVVAFGNNQLWRPLAAKVQGHHSGLPKNMVSLIKPCHILEAGVARALGSAITIIIIIIIILHNYNTNVIIITLYTYLLSLL